jgi:hypothetical protein
MPARRPTAVSIVYSKSSVIHAYPFFQITSGRILKAAFTQDDNVALHLRDIRQRTDGIRLLRRLKTSVDLPGSASRSGHKESPVHNDPKIRDLKRGLAVQGTAPVPASSKKSQGNPSNATHSPLPVHGHIVGRYWTRIEIPWVRPKLKLFRTPREALEIAVHPNRQPISPSSCLPNRAIPRSGQGTNLR